MLSTATPTSLPDPIKDINHGSPRPFPTITWPTCPDLPQLKGSTILGIGRILYNYSPDAILKLDTDEAKRVFSLPVSLDCPSSSSGLVSTLHSVQSVVKSNLAMLLVRMRAPRGRFNYYGRPGTQPYITLSEFGPNNTHDFCGTRLDWDASRVRAVKTAALETEVLDDRIRALERVQHETGVGATLVDDPVLTHGDFSGRNILLDPTTLDVTGFIDWELANVAPAYFEYTIACLAGGHLPEWRRDLLELLHEVLRIECEHKVVEDSGLASSSSNEMAIKTLFRETLTAWNALVNVERPAQGYSDECYWTFENEFLPPLLK
nr:hypothetical protein CFP56_30016 [Quercus suber]